MILIFLSVSIIDTGDGGGKASIFVKTGMKGRVAVVRMKGENQ